MTTINWVSLNSKTDQYTALTSLTDPVSGLVSITFCGLHTSMSAVLAGLPAKGANSIAIFADSLDLDVASVKSTGLILMVREINVSGLKGNPLLLDMSASGDGVAQLMIGSVTGGTFTITSTGGQSPVLTPPIGSAPLNAALFVQKNSKDALALTPSGGVSSVQNLVSRSWSLNNLMACYAAAAWLMDDGSPDELATARAMFAWIVACSGILASNGAQMPSDYAQLYNQAAALLVTLNVAPGAVFVPVLSGNFYSHQIDKLLTVLRDYEANMATLDTQADVATAIATVSAGLRATASYEAAPLQIQLNNISENIQTLNSDIHNLEANFMLQTQRANTAFGVLEDAMSLAKIKETLSAEFELSMSVISVGFDAIKINEGDSDGLKSAIEDSSKAITSLIGVINAAQADGAGDNLAQGAVELLTSLNILMGSVLNGSLLWNQVQAGQSGSVLPSHLAAITVDPVTSWTNYMAAAEARLSILKRQIGNDSDAAQDAADLYLASLKVLVGYGKAISGKFVAYVGQLVQATVVQAQIKAASDVEARWTAIQSKATSDAEKLAALKALIEGRSSAIKRSIYVSWTYYAASYFFLTFTTPSRALHMNMNAADLEAALVGVADWVAAAISGTPDGQHVMLPSVNANIELEFDILQPGATAVAGRDTALLSKADDGGWLLTWVVPTGTSQLDGVLPNNGQCAIWISKASYFLDGVTANNKGNVISVVATSGAYENGFGTQSSHTFATKGLSGNFCYSASTPANPTVYSPWVIDTAVYMTPTPYTQWTMSLPPNGGDPSTATQLRMELTVAYLTPPNS